MRTIAKCAVCDDKDPPIRGCGKDVCPFPRSLELRRKMEAYKKRVLESGRVRWPEAKRAR